MICNWIDNIKESKCLLVAVQQLPYLNGEEERDIEKN